LKSFFAAVLTLVVFAAIGGMTRLAAQGARATILGTVTDSTGAVIADAAVQVNSASARTQTPDNIFIDRSPWRL